MAPLTVDAFMARARGIVARPVDAAVRDEIGRLLQELARSGTIALDRVGSGLHGSAAGQAILASDEGALTLMLVRFPEESATPVHDHRSWGVACVVAGVDHYMRWRREDDGATDGRASVVVDRDFEMRPGDVTHWGDPPDDIHSQQGVGGPAFELVCFGRNPMRTLRSYFDPKRGTVEERPAV
jgi:3-mercaptopropionate dioxygenase